MDIDHLQRLAGLRLDGRQQRQLAADLQKLQQSIEQLEAVDVSGVEPATSPVEVKAEPRRDTAREPLSRSDALSNAPEADGGKFSTPSTGSTRDEDA